MKILALIPTSKEQCGNWSRLHREIKEVSVVKILRSYTDCLKRGYHYRAFISEHPCLHQEAYRPDGIHCEVSVDRKLNKKWKPPVFPVGVNVIDIPIEDSI